MPVLGGFPVVIDLPDQPAAEAAARRESRTLAFRALDGTLVLPLNGRTYVGLNGMTGLDAPPLEVTIDRPYGVVGGRVRSIDYTPREVFIPLYMRAVSHPGLLDLRDRLDSLFDHHGVDYTEQDGTFDVVANSVRGERTLRCAYLGGMEGELTRTAAGALFETAGIKAVAVRPLWHAGQWATPPIRLRPPEHAWFGSFPGTLSTDSTLNGDTTVYVRGDAESWPVLSVTGPCTSLSIAAGGLSLSIPDGLAEGEVALVVTEPRRRSATFNGVHDPGRIGPTDLYQPLSPGYQTVTFDIEDATLATVAYVSGDIWQRRPW